MQGKVKKKKGILLEIGKSIQFWRKLNGYDQVTFSVLLKTARSYISRIESGHTGISLGRIEKIAQLLEVSPFTILKGAPSKEVGETILNLYQNTDYKITKKELEDIYCTGLNGKKMTRDYFIHMLCIIRSNVFVLDKHKI